MSELKALIFDVDGTMADTERDGHRVAFNRAFADAGLEWRWPVSLYGELLAVAGGKERIRHYVDHHRPEFEPPEDLEAYVADLHASKTRHYIGLLSEGAIPLRPGVRRLLDEARRAGLRLAIATTTSPPNVTNLLKHTLGAGSMDWFEVIAAGDIVPSKKPAPDIYHYTLERMDLRAEECLAFEDSENGLVSALEVGMPAVITVNHYTQNQDFSGAALVLTDLGEPDRPFEVVAGDAGDADFFDISLAGRVHARATS